MSATLCEQVIEITTNYLGPTAKRFVYRQVSVHLNKSPESLDSKDLPILADWSKLALGLITNDKNEVDRFEQDILSLSKAGGKSKKVSA